MPSRGTRLAFENQPLARARPGARTHKAQFIANWQLSGISRRIPLHQTEGNRGLEARLLPDENLTAYPSDV